MSCGGWHRHGPPIWASEAQYRAAYDHANQRLRERYGEDLRFEDYAALCLALSEHREVLAACEGHREVCRVKVGGSTTRAIYEPGAAVIVTFLPSHGHARTDAESQRNHRRKGKWQ